LQLRQAVGVEKWEQEQTSDGDNLHRKRNQSYPTAARTVDPSSVEQGISKHGVLPNFRASSKDTGLRSRGREATAILQK